MLITKMDFLISYGWLGIALHANTYEPRFKMTNQHLTRSLIHIEHVIGILNIFAILFQRDSYRRRRFALRFNLISSTTGTQTQILTYAKGLLNSDIEKLSKR